MTKSASLEKLIPNLQTFADDTFEPTYKVKKSGGREMVIGKDSFKLKEVINRLQTLAEKELKDSKNDPRVKQTIEEVVAKGAMLLVHGNASLKVATLWQKFVTWLCQTFGNLGKPSHFKTLEKMRAEFVFPEKLNKKAEEAKQALIKAYEKDKKLITEVVSAFKKADTDKKDDGKEVKKKIKELDIAPYQVFADLVSEDPLQASLLLQELKKKYSNLATFLLVKTGDDNKEFSVMNGLFDKNFGKLFLKAATEEVKKEQKKEKEVAEKAKAEKKAEGKKTEEKDNKKKKGTDKAE